jgi:SAM-dependent methyltransferase/uncharacterized protein YbaR (Trm112 family)
MQTHLERVLRCPASHGELRLADPEQLGAIQSRIAARTLTHRDGTPVKKPIDQALCSTDGTWGYRIDQGIAVLLPHLALALKPTLHAAPNLRPEKQLVQRFYDEVGWTKGDVGSAYVDAEKWEDLRPVAWRYVHRCRERIRRYLPPRGSYLLDAASGPVQYDEYREYSRHYVKRVCVDMSFRALLEAKHRLGDHGIYLLADITNLPLKDDTMDGVLSLHTIYHVAADEQAQAFCELYRCLKPGGMGAVVYSWGGHAPLAKLAFVPHRLAARARTLPRQLKRLAQRLAGYHDIDRPAAPPAGPYYHPYDYHWFRRQTFPFPLEIVAWRSADVRLLQSYVHAGLGGRKFLDVLFQLEERFPRFLGRVGQYPLFRISKPS